MVDGISQQEPATGEVVDPLLDCLAILTKFHNRSYSVDALRAGLPLVDHRLTPSLFVRAAERAGFSARLVKRSLSSISNLVLPVVLLLENNQACILHKLNDDQTVEIIMPESGGIIHKTLEEINAVYTGYAIFIQPIIEFEARSADNKKTTRSGGWFWDTFWRYRRIYTEVIIASLLINIFTLVSPLFVMNVYDRVVPNKAEVTLWVLAIGVLIVYLFDFILRNLRGYFIDLCGKKADIIISSLLFERVLGMQMTNKPSSAGSFVNNLREFETLRDFFASATLTGIVDLPFTVLFLLLTWFIGGYIVWVPLVAIPIVVLAGFFTAKPLGQAVQQAMQGAAQKNAVLVEAIVGLETVKCLRAEGLLQGKWETFVASTAKWGLRSRFLSSLVTNIVAYTQQLVTVGTIVVGVYAIHAGDLTMGGLIACNILAARVLAPLAQMTSLLTRYEQSKEALSNLNKVAALSQERPAQMRYVPRPHLQGQIEFNQVSFQYPGQQVPALNNLSFKINAGERVAIIGRVGMGKSTIQKLILGLYSPQSGSIRIDGVDIAQIDPADLRRNIGYVPQECLLFYGSVRDNIVMSAPWTQDEKIIQAAKITGVDAFISRNPLGYNLPIGERGENLSGGQKQAVVLARAILNNPPILLFDEPSSAMDNNTEKELLMQLATYVPQKTLLLATHKLSVLPLVERLIVLDNGHVAADGPKDKVIAALTQAAQVQAKT